MNYLFILGRESQLSKAEIIQSLHAYQVDFAIISHSHEAMVVEVDYLPELFFERLGGSIKYGIVESQTEQDAFVKVKSMVSSEASERKKFRFGMSVYAANDEVSDQEVTSWQQESHEVGFDCKDELKVAGISSRYVTARTPQLSSVVVKKSKLLEDGGMEILIALDTDHIWVGKTEAVQDFQRFSDLDYGRPARDDYSGMLPPKLARIMLNLSGLAITGKSVVLDPFCGSGTVLQEALLLGAGKVLGSDVSDKAIADSQENLTWLQQFEVINADVKLEQVDVQDLSGWIPKDHVDVIVTEPFLGDPVRKELSAGEISKRQQALSELYDSALRQIHMVLKDGGRAVMIFPFIEEHRLPTPKALQLFDVIELGGFENERGGIDYKRPNQHVGREIFVLQKKSL